MRRVVLVIIWIFVFSSESLFAQISPLDSLSHFVKNVNAFNYLYPQEKVYLHFDNTGYFMGEDMYFKAYVVAGALHKPTTMSGILYVELLSPEGRILQSNKLKITNGQAWGRFQLSNLLHAGYYEVRAYTRMMLNWDERGVFSRVFPVFDRAKTTADFLSPTMTLSQRSQKVPVERQKPKSHSNSSLQMSFYPEGGDLIDEATQTIAFKVVNRDGIGQKVNGVIIDATGNTITNLSTAFNGIGTVQMQSINGAKAQIYHEGKNYTFSLPKSLPSGYVIHVDALRTDAVGIRVTRHNITTSTPMALAVINGGYAYIFQKLDFSDDEFAMAIEHDALRDGVNQIIVFDEWGTIFCQRMVFHRPTTTLKFTAEFDKPNYQPFDSIVMNFTLHDSTNNPVASTFSLAVHDSDFNIPGSHTGNALSNLLLSSDLRGFIQNIDYYFESTDDEHNKALDNLMLTQGWYRYDFQTMSHPENFKIRHFIEEGLTISGQLTSYMRHREKSGAEITVMLYDLDKGLSKKGRAKTDSTGHFAFRSEDFEGRLKMFIKTKDENQKNKEMNVHLDRQFSPDSRPYEPLDTWMYIRTTRREHLSSNSKSSSNAPQSLNKYKYENLLPEAVVTAGKRWMEGKAIKQANIVYDLEEERTREDDTGELYLETLFDYLERANKYFSFTLDADGNHTSLYKGRPVQFIIDNVDHSLVDVERLFAKDLEAILICDKFGAVRRYSTYTGLDSINGTSSAQTTDLIGEMSSNSSNSSNSDQLDETENELQKSDSLDNIVVIHLYIDKNAKKDRRGERNTVVQGFTHYVDFYSPDYSDFVLPNEKDYRRTLYWNPNIEINKEGKARVKFFNTGCCTQIDFSAETVTANGGIAVVGK